MRPKGTPQELEQRRRRALKLLSEGRGVRQTARMVGASAGSVTAWRQAVERGGEAALAARDHPGRRSKLSEQQRRELPLLLEATAQRMNCDVAELTLSSIVRLIERIFGVHYDPSSVWHLLRRMRSAPGSAPQTNCDVRRTVVAQSVDFPLAFPLASQASPLMVLQHG